jgi:geranylgeranyl diphosphate synthase type I
MQWIAEVKQAVDGRLEKVFAARRAELEVVAPDARLVLDGLEALTLRGGKRLRPALLVAAQRAVDPHAEVADVISACAALEVLQSYLLIHDDWMDGDEERRGGPAVHVQLRRALRDSGRSEASSGGAHLGDALAILSGDLGAALATELMLESAALSERGRDALAVFVRVQRDVVYGQAMDLLGSRDVSRMQRLKTGSYTVEGPLVIGAILGKATEGQLAALRRYGEPLGEAFQIRDDLLGTFGDPARTGKPAGGDLRTGKRTALVTELEHSVPAKERGAVEAVLGRADASAGELARAAESLVRLGVKERVEARLAALVGQACHALDGAPLVLAGAGLLRDLAHLVGARES